MKMMQTMSRRSCLALGASAMAACVTRPAGAAPVQPDIVVELFTSQGCSSCPRADQLLGEISSQPGVVALTYHVDYWDYLGWKDTLASKDFSQRQYDYAKARGDMDVYTPQMVVNGETPVVGNQRSEVYAALDRSRVKSWKVPLQFSASGNEITIDMGTGEASPEATLWVLARQSEVMTKIEKGELAGRDILSHNVVRRIIPAGMWTGRSQKIVLPKDGLLPPGSNSCVALLQKGKTGPLLGVAVWDAGTS
jgi:hypothetical protein